jgi:hypothetical protein
VPPATTPPPASGKQLPSVHSASSGTSQSSAGGRLRLKSDLSYAVHKLFEIVAPLARTIVPIVPPEIKTKLAAMAEFTVRARTSVARDGYKKFLSDITRPESATRFAQQFCELAKGSALIDGRSEVNESDYLLARRVAQDCIPALRKRAIGTLLKSSGLSEQEFAEASGIAAGTVHFVLEDLHEVGLANGTYLSANARKWLTIAGFIQ